MAFSPEQREAYKAIHRDGELTPDELIEAARPEDSPLHSLFNWNDEEEAHKQRRHVARGLIRRFRIEYTVTTREMKIPPMVRSPHAAPKEQGYRRTDLFKSKPEDSRAVLEAELKRIEGHVKRARELAWKFGLTAEFEERLADALAVKAEAA